MSQCTAAHLSIFIFQAKCKTRCPAQSFVHCEGLPSLISFWVISEISNSAAAVHFQVIPVYHAEPLMNQVLVFSSSAPFKSLMVTLIYAIPPGIQYCFWVTVFSGLGNSRGFHLTFPTIIAITSQVRNPMWEFCQVLSISIPIILSEIGEITPGWFWRITGPTVSQTLTKTPLIPWPD